MLLLRVLIRQRIVDRVRERVMGKGKDKQNREAGRQTDRQQRYRHTDIERARKGEREFCDPKTQGNYSIASITSSQHSKRKKTDKEFLRCKNYITSSDYRIRNINLVSLDNRCRTKSQRQTRLHITPSGPWPKEARRKNELKSPPSFGQGTTRRGKNGLVYPLQKARSFVWGRRVLLSRSRLFWGNIVCLERLGRGYLRCLLGCSKG